MQTPKGSHRNGLLEVPKKISPRAVRQLKTTGLERDSGTFNQPGRVSKVQSPKGIERRSPKSLLPEKKRPSRISELEAQVSQLQEELKKAKDEINSSESLKKQAQKDAEESRNQLSAISLELEESKRRLLELSGSEEPHIVEQGKILQDQDQTCQPELETGLKQHSAEAAALASAMGEIQRIDGQLQTSVNSESTSPSLEESARAEIEGLKVSLAESLSLMEDMKNQLKDTKESESEAQALATETLQQLETAKQTVEELGYENVKAVAAYHDIASELEQSRGHVTSLKEFVSKLEANLSKTACSSFGDADSDSIMQETGENQASGEQMQPEKEILLLKCEVGRLRSALKSAEAKYQEEHAQDIAQVMKAQARAEQIKSVASDRDAQLMAELLKAKSGIEELKANLMDKELELQGISEENEALRVKLEHISCQQEQERERELCELREVISELKANMMDKETELQNIVEENEMLRSEFGRKEIDNGEVNEKVIAELELARDAEQQVLVKQGNVADEADKNNQWTARFAQQLEAAQTANNELEAELRRLKVQSDQWRKAAEAAAAILSAGNNGKFMERTGSMDSNLKPFPGKITAPFSEDMEEDLKKKHANMLKKIGMLWKKPHN